MGASAPNTGNIQRNDIWFDAGIRNSLFIGRL